MNKELILKYKVEFDHWLNGGKILYASYDLDEKNYSAWYELHHDCKWDYNNAYRFKFIINDAYVELRKALAEGKTIQLNEAEKFSDQNRGWVDLSCTSLGSSTNLFPVEYYRIKPEEPKFKVGDWVRVKTGTFEYDGTARISKGVKRLSKSDMWLFNENHYKCNPDNYIEHWQPKEGEWCWVGYKLMKFSKLIKEDYSTTFEFISPNRDADGYKIKEHILERHLQIVEPFIGQLPTTIEQY